MDSLHAIGFYVSAALAGAGGILTAFLGGHWRRGLALALTGLGVAGIYASLSAGFAAVVVLICFVAGGAPGGETRQPGGGEGPRGRLRAPRRPRPRPPFSR